MKRALLLVIIAAGAAFASPEDHEIVQGLMTVTGKVTLEDLEGGKFSLFG